MISEISVRGQKQVLVKASKSNKKDAPDRFASFRFAPDRFAWFRFANETAENPGYESQQYI